MRDYLLFVDTEASGLPKKWTEPYSSEKNWPYAVQVSWIIYTKDGIEIKREDYYISDDDFSIEPGAIKIHGITRSYLNVNGSLRKEVMQILSDDLNKYNPLVIGHFIELDYHVMAADFFRSGVENPIEEKKLPSFCTMLSTTKFVRNPARKFMKLGELYHTLFAKELEKPHNAIYDAKATADCFFELLRRGEIDESIIDQYNVDFTIRKNDQKPLWLFFALAFLVSLLIAFTHG